MRFPGPLKQRLWLGRNLHVWLCWRHPAVYMMAGDGILGLQRILGHSSITMTKRYAHLSPYHLESALRLSPLAQAGHVASLQAGVRDGINV